MITNNKRQAVRRQDCLREYVSYFLCCTRKRDFSVCNYLRRYVDVCTRAKDKIAHVLFSKSLDKGKMNFLTIL